MCWLGRYICRSASLIFLVAHSTVCPQVSPKLESSTVREVSIVLTRNDSLVRLPHTLIIKGSETVQLDTIVLAPSTEYTLDDRFGVILFQPDLVERLRRDTTAVHTLTARYRILPFQIKDRYQRRELVVRRDTTSGEQIRISRPTSTFSVDDLFGSDLQKNGSIVRGFTVGSNRDLSLTSGFRMQMAGKVASDVEVVAALTDENTPIQPEGNTQTLSEIDKVFVEIRSTDVSATLGDFNLDFTGNEFGGYHRKLQGAKGVANYRAGPVDGSLMLSGAITRGKFVTNQFQGAEGVQGPYRLTGQNNERDIIIVAGTEKVYVDGELMTRGETNDYTIDYASGEVTFTSRRLITGFSRMVIDFEYTDRQFTRNLIGARTGAALANDKFRISVTFVREADDQDSPIDISLSESDREILRNAGADRLKASRSGVDSIGPGRGQYAAVDTTIGGIPMPVYRFIPYDSTALYNVFFSFVGAGQGDYARISIGHFQFVGVGRGSYLPIRFLPMPQLQTLTDVDLNAKITDYLSVSGEYAFSAIDVNRFSSIDDVDSRGPAVNVGVKLNPNNVRLGGVNIGSFDLTLRERFVDRRFTPIDRTNDIEFNRRWNLEQPGKVDEEIREARLSYRPVQAITIAGGVGSLSRGDEFASNRSEAAFSFRAEDLPRVGYNLEFITTRDQPLNDRTGWLRHRGTVDYTFRSFTPGFRYENEIKRSNPSAVDSLKFGSFRFHEFAPRLHLEGLWNMSLTSEFTLRLGDSVVAGVLKRESETFTQQYAWKLREWNSLSSGIDVTLRKKRHTEQFRLRGNSDVETILLRFQSRYTPFDRGVETDLFYEAATQRASKLERVFVRVSKGTGTLRYLGDVNGNGVIDDPDFQIDRFDGEFIVTTVPSDELFPIVDLRTSVRLRVTPARFLASQAPVWAILSALSAETYLRVEEKSREADTRSIYFLNFGRFLSDSMTIVGSNFISQDLHVLENRADFSLRLRYAQRNGFAQFSLANERTYARERSVRVRWQLVKEIANQTDYVNKSDRVSATQRTSRTRNITSNTIQSDWSYRPEQTIELGFVVGVGRAVDRDSVPPITADINNQGARCVYSFQERGQARVELQREEVQLDGRSAFLPFELTGGRLPGKTWLWRATFEYRLTQFLQSTVSYDGRSEGGGDPIHTARAEVRAFF